MNEGKPVFYNMKIHLVHAQSNQYLDAFSDSSEHHSFSVQMSNQGSFSSLFLIVPMYNTLSTNDYIQIDDQFKIKNFKTDYFLAYTMKKGYVSFADLNITHGYSKDKTVLDLNTGREELNDCAVILSEKGVVWGSKLIKRECYLAKDVVLSNELCRIVFPHFSSELTSDYSYLVNFE